MSALATVGTGGKMEGVMEGGKDRRIISPCQKPLFWYLGIRSDDLDGDTG